MRNRDLWRRLEAFEFDAPGSDAPFSLKLAVAENWNDDYTVRVLEEYRRFLYLTQIQSAQITPSIPVDRAWHMHMTYTRSYWEDLCAGVIGAKLHHNPVESEADMPRYLAQYEATKTLYEREFGAAPPEDIWPGKATDDPDRHFPHRYFSDRSPAVFISSSAWRNACGRRRNDLFCLESGAKA